MSEFSSSIHFIDDDMNNISDFLKKENISAVILGTNDKTVSVLIGWDENIKNKIYGKAKFIDYQYGEDHGIWIRFYNNGKVMAKIIFTWGDDFGIEEENEDFKPGVTKDISKILLDNNFIISDISKELYLLINNFNPNDWAKRENFIDNIGNLLGLFAFRWLSYDSFSVNIETYKNNFPNLIIIK